MLVKQAIAMIVVLAGCAVASAQQATQVQLKIDSTNRTLTVSAEERVTADPDLAILHIGFQTPPSDAKTAYDLGAKTSNDIVSALKLAGIPENAIRSENQHLNSESGKLHKFRLVQEWTVKSPPERAAEILDVAVAAGATDSGRIDWTLKDLSALEDQALAKAAVRAKADAAALAKAMGVQMGAMLYATNTSMTSQFAGGLMNGNNAVAGDYMALPRALAIEPRKVSRTATVYAVFAIE